MAAADGIQRSPTETTAADAVVAGLPVGLAARLGDALAVLGPAGTVVWANEQAARLLGLSVEELLGADGLLGFVHPEELDRALDGIAYATARPDRTAVVPFRLRRGDGWVDVELKSAVIEADDGDYLALMIRDGTTRRTVSRALATVAEGEPVAVTAAWLASAVTSRWEPSAAAVVLRDADGGVEVVGDRLDPALAELLLAADPAGTMPWTTAVATGELVTVDGEDLPEPARSLAGAAGYTTCGVAPVVDPAGGSAVIVAWFDFPDAARFEFAHGSIELCELLSLALERRHHVAQLRHAARHDGLTELLNRTGFLEHAASVLGALGAPDRAGLLFIDLDGFKGVNDEYGHAAGDAVLCEVADRLGALCGPSVARLGGDEFAVVPVASSGDAVEVFGSLADRIVTSLGEPYLVADPRDPSAELVLHVGASVGVALAESATAPAALLDLADEAMYSAKAEGRGRWRLRTAS